jgi:hypothetical protein
MDIKDVGGIIKTCKSEQRVASSEELKYILESPVGCSIYARLILKGKFEEGEDSIAKSYSASLHYACTIRGRFPKGEVTILKQGGYYLEAYFLLLDNLGSLDGFEFGNNTQAN